MARAAAAKRKAVRQARRTRVARRSCAAAQRAVRAGPKPLGPVPAKGLGLFGRALRYGERRYRLWELLWNTSDKRVGARVPTGRVAVSFAVLMLTRLRSLNGYEQQTPPPAWTRWLGGPRPSADVMGDAASTMGLDPLRHILGVQHAVLKRNKGFRRPGHGLRLLILDGHEGVASYRRRWDNALERVVHFAQGDKTQYYFRSVCAYLTNGERPLMLDAEAQLPGEGEIACAMRLLTRLLAAYPRAFDVVCGDNLYMNPELWKLVRQHKKHLIAVLKNEGRDLLTDARALFAHETPIALDDKTTRRQCWDLSGFTTWPQCGEPVRVVRSLETTTHRPQLDRKTATPEQTTESEWFWVTSLPPHRADTAAIVRIGHGRWDIENRLFNELSTRWHADHGYRYHAHALVVCLLLLFIAYNLFLAFIERNLKPPLRTRHTALYWADRITADRFETFCAPADTG